MSTSELRFGFAKPKRLCRSVIPAGARMFRWETAAEFHLESGMRRAQLHHARLCKADNIVFLRSAFYSRWHMALLQERRISIRPHRAARALSILLITDSREILPESLHAKEDALPISFCPYSVCAIPLNFQLYPFRIDKRTEAMPQNIGD